MTDVEPDGAAINYPDWTEYSKKNGLDPLGMQNSGINLYQTFLPGISNVTLRMRYYGLYAWLCQIYAQTIGDTDPETWKRYIRRTEALYALIAFHHGGETGVAGIEWAKSALENLEGDVIDFAVAAEPGSETHYLKQAWGAYGAAYGSQLFEIGILVRSQDHEIPLPSAETGERLAALLDETLGALSEQFFEIIERGTVTIDELDQFTFLAPSEINPAGGERGLYQELLLNESDSDDLPAISRRLSILLILKITELLGREPKPDEVRWILYAGCDQQGQALALGSPELEAQRQRWWVYQANDLCHVALETLLKFTLDTLGLYPAGIALERLIPLCVGEILGAADQAATHWPDLLEGVQLSDNAYAADDPSSEWSLSRDIIRGAGRRDDQQCTPEIAWQAVKLLATLHKRIRDEDHDIEAELGRFNSDGFRSLLSETQFLDAQSEESLSEVIGRILEERVVRRHLWIALKKFRHQKDYTFLIEMDEGKLRLREKDGPMFTNPRLGPAIRFLTDIHLVSAQGLTIEGAQALEAQ